MEQMAIVTESDSLFSNFLESLAYFIRSETIIHHLDCIKVFTPVLEFSYY